MAETTITVVADRVSYYVQTIAGRQRKKALLRSVSLVACPGQLIYIMGPSGAGKSTLLDLLAGRLTTGWLGGELYFNGLPSKEAWRRLSQHMVYVRQADVHQPSLTVRETLDYAARFHMAGGREVRERRVTEVAELLGLKNVMNNRVGGQFARGISGGQMKRLSIGVEIMQTPALLMLDEPTSGLDSVMAREVMVFVASLCKQQHSPPATVMCTIHQPGEEVLNLADGLVLLSKGYVCFRGTPQDAKAHFLQHCSSTTYTTGVAAMTSNTADFLLDVVSGPSSRAYRLHQLYLTSPTYYRPLPAITTTTTTTTGTSGKSSSSYYRTSLWRQVTTLLHRGWRVLSRQPFFLRTIMVRDIFAGLLYGAVFFQQGALHKAPSSSAAALSPVSLNMASQLYFCAYSLLWQNMEALGQYFSWRGLYEKERGAHAYSPLAFTLASPLFVLPYTTLGFFLFLLLLCLLSDTTPLLTASHGLAWAIYLVAMVNTYLFAYALAALTKHAELAYVFTPIAFVLMGSLTGFVVTLHNMPLIWQWLTSIVYLRYAYKATVELQFRGRPDHDAVVGYLSLDEVPFTPLGCLGVLLIFTAIFLALVYYALLPPRVRLQRASESNGQGRSSSRASSESSSHEGAGHRRGDDGGSGRWGAGRRGRFLLLPLLSPRGGRGNEEEEEKNSMVTKRLLAEEEGEDDGAVGQEEDEDEDQDAGRPLLHHAAGGSRSGHSQASSFSSSAAPLTLADFCERSSSVPAGNGGVMYFKDVGYRVDVGRRGRKRTLEVLKGGISGMLSSGEMMALMGPSGAGKTTLLDVLASYKTMGRVSGRIVKSREVKGQCYITQDDVHLGTLTVRETLEFASRLRIDEEVSPSDRRRRVTDVERMLGLDDVRDVLVGDSFTKGISGGQLRRLTIGVEIMNLADLIFLDEPTTGLDSTSALEVMSAVRSLSLRGRLVVCTLHQPSPDIFSLFDKLTLLAAGRLLYHGTLADFPRYVGSMGVDPSIEPSLPDLVIKVASGVLPGLPPIDVSEADKDEDTLAARFTRSPQGCALASALDMLEGQEAQEERSKGHGGTMGRWGSSSRGWRRKRPYPRSLLSQIRILNQRQFLTIGKDFRSLVINNLNYICLGLFWGSLFAAKHSDQTTLGFLFSGLMVVTFSNQLIIPVIYAQRPLLYRERAAGVYGTLAYCLSCDTPYIVMVVVTSLFFSSLVYRWGGLQPGIGPWAFYYLCLTLTSMASLNLIGCLSALLPSERELAAIWSLSGYVLSILAGYMSRLPTFPRFVQLCSQASFTRWAFEGLAVNQFGGTNDAFLEELGFGGSSKWDSILALVLFIALFKALQVCAVKWLTFERR